MKKKNKKIMVAGMLVAILAGCSEIHEPGIGEKTALHGYYEIVVNSTEQQASATYLDKYGAEKSRQKNGCTYVTIDLVVYGKKSDEADHSLDKDDFKLSIDRTGRNHIGTVLQDYNWIGKHIAKDSEEAINITFEVADSLLSQVKYLEADFSNAPLDATMIKLN